MSTRKAFEDSIQLDRYDQVTRLVFADWLEENGHDDEALAQRSWTRELQEAVDRLTDFAAFLAEMVGSGDDPEVDEWSREYNNKEVPRSYDELLAAMDRFASGKDWSEHITLYGFDTPDRAYREAPLLWDAYETITGKSVPAERRHNFVSCSC